MNERCRSSAFPPSLHLRFFVWAPIVAPGPHLASSLVGEGHSQDSSGTDPTRNHVRDPVRNNPSLASPRPSKNQYRPSNRFDGLSLLWIQRTEAYHARAEFKTTRRFRKLNEEKSYSR
jgi:hypothetical protein